MQFSWETDSCCGKGNKLVVAWAFPRDHIGVVGTVVSSPRAWACGPRALRHNCANNSNVALGPRQQLIPTVWEKMLNWWRCVLWYTPQRSPVQFSFHSMYLSMSLLGMQVYSFPSVHTHINLFHTVDDMDYVAIII